MGFKQESELKNNHKAKSLAVFGTGSDVGKSVITAALCRFLWEQKIKVAPFKAQNMSNNSGVTPEGLEMGRAQIVQAEASGIPPHVDMNPILLKPTSEVGSQVILLGKSLENHTAAEYHRKKKHLFASACAALDRLRSIHEVVVLEGAGSCAEVNLMENDIVNFKMAEYADAPVILVADIHRGGVFAQIVGTLACLSQKEQDRIAGVIINRFRGDISLFDEGIRWLECKTGKPVLGVLPWYDHIRIEEEDSVVLEKPAVPPVLSRNTLQIAVIKLPHISNFTDFHPLANLAGISLRFVDKPIDPSLFGALILPGSKNTRADLHWLHQTGWADQIIRCADSGGHILGICGGYQMLGQMVHDPDGLEGPCGSGRGLGLLPVETTLSAPKTTTLTSFSWDRQTGTGYEIHMGKTVRHGAEALFQVHSRNRVLCNDDEGCVEKNSRIMGTYIHGLFETPEITGKWLKTIGYGHIPVDSTGGLAAREKEYKLLSKHFHEHINTQLIMDLL